MIKIGVIVAKNSLKDIYPVVEKYKEQSEIHFYTYDKTSQIKSLYQKNVLLNDAIVLNWLAYHALEKLNVHFSKPTYYYVLNERDLYKKLFQISMKYRNLDFSRVFFDYKLIGNVVVDEDFEEMLQLYLKNIESHLINLDMTDDFYRNLLDNHKLSHQQGKADLSITTFSNIFNDLVDAGIPTELISASMDTITELFEKVMIEVSHQKLLDRTMVVGKVSSDAFLVSQLQTNTEYNRSLVFTALHDFSRKHHVTMIIQQHTTFFELFISKKELAEITNDFTTDTLAQHLTNTIAFETYVGWGIGNNIDDARKKAYLANHEAHLQKQPSIIVDHSNQMINTSTVLENDVLFVEETPELKRMSEEYEISILLLKKITTVIQKAETNEITSDDIAYHLGITTRSANRMLNELESKGIATYVYTKHEKQRGRPKKVYTIQFEK